MRIDLTIADDGPRIILRGAVIATRSQTSSESRTGCSIALDAIEREKINYINGFVRGGLLDLRERRRLPVRLDISYGGIDGTEQSYCRDINEEGVFVVAEEPLPEESQLQLLIFFPDHDKGALVSGTVSHTVVIEDEDIPGMGIVFDFTEAEKASFSELIDELEDKFVHGRLSDNFLL